MSSPASDSDPLGDAIGLAVSDAIAIAHADDYAERESHFHRVADTDTYRGTPDACPYCNSDTYSIADTAPDSAAERY